MNIDEFFTQRAEDMKAIGLYIGGTIKTRKNNIEYIVMPEDFTPDMKKEYLPEDFLFDVKYEWLIYLIEKIESKTKYSLVIYPNYCYWINEDGETIYDEFYGENRLDAMYMACKFEILKKL